MAHETVHELVDHLFRRQAGQMMATLARVLGLRDWDVAEEAVQDAMVQALRTWPFRGVPDDPRAWLAQVARNRALDLLRRRTRLRRAEGEVERQLLEREAALARCELGDGDGAADDDQLAMMFACCHPALSPDARVALTLKAVGGFGVAEIARAFLAEVPAVSQRLVRAKRLIQERDIALRVPPPAELPGRLDSVLQAVYLLFNEGYLSHAGQDLVRQDLCAEAIRLVELLVRRPETARPDVYALAALMCLQAARLPARVDGRGDLLLLEEQDRSAWDQGLLHRGLWHLDRAAAGDRLTAYHVQAGIAAAHATAAGYDDTDWPALLGWYDALSALDPSPVAALNRAVVLSKVAGPAAGLEALDQLVDEPTLRTYYLLPAARADMLRRLGRLDEAADCYRRAVGLRCTEPERRFLLRRLESLSPGQSSVGAHPSEIC